MAPRSEESRNKQLRALARENLQGLQQRTTKDLSATSMKRALRSL